MNKEDQRPFSHRHGYSPPEREITVREETPEELRCALLHIAEEAGLTHRQLRHIVCKVLRKIPDSNNWSDLNIWGEVQDLISYCDWFRVYDIAEAIYKGLPREPAKEYENSLNDYFRENGIGWQMNLGKIITRGPDAIEAVVRKAISKTEASGQKTANNELNEAIRDLSRRPDPDVTGAIQHAMAALECVAKEICGEPKATLGKLLSKLPLPKPLDVVIDKAWGYASEKGRHLQEGQIPGYEEAVLVVGLASTVATYLSSKKSLREPLCNDRKEQF